MVLIIDLKKNSIAQKNKKMHPMPKKKKKKKKLRNVFLI